MKMQQKFQCVVAGPSNLLAMLNSLQMGFKTLAVQEQGEQVWKVLAGAKNEFKKFGEHIAKVKSKLDQAGNSLDDIGVRTRAIERNLRDVELIDSEDTKIKAVPSSTLVKS